MAYDNPLLTEPVTEEALKNHHCWENVDRVSGDPETTKFKRSARLLQSLWREANLLPIGSQPPRPKENQRQRPLGSRIDLEYAVDTGANFLTDHIYQAVEHRLAHPQPHQMLDSDRLYCDLLSSMPMCFNLFGELWADLALADRAIHTWWPDTPGVTSAVEFEWSPGRSRKGEYLENKSAFDVAFILELGDGQKGVVGVETKYHEHSSLMTRPSRQRTKRYREVAEKSGVFAQGTIDAIIGTELEQLFLDHLLALSMPLQPDTRWSWARFIVVYPEANPSIRRATEAYRELIGATDSFGVDTVESLLDADVHPSDLAARFRERYLWNAHR